MTQQKSAWRWFPAWLFAAMSVVAVVNGGMVYAALHTFPGEAGEDGFDLGNSYGRVLDGVARQNALGWQVDSAADAARHPVLKVADRSGRPLGDASVQVTAARPLGPPERTALTLKPDASGRMVAAEALPRGQWVLSVIVTDAGETLSTTERLVIR